jgi:glycosyltransferase involved in cell wall biosynthesis
MRVRALPLAKALATRGHKVTVVLPPWSNPEDAGRTWEDDGAHVVNIALPPRLPLLSHLVITWRLVRHALATRPDVVHCFKPKSYAGLVALTIRVLQRLGLTHTRLVVDSDDWEGPGGWNEIERYSWAQKRFFAWQERWGLTHCNAVTVASRALESIVWSLGMPSQRVFYVPNGRTGDACVASISAGASVLLYTRFFEFRVERVVDLLRRVLAEAPEARLLVVGKGLFGEEERLLRLVHEAGIADRIDYAGWVEPNELPRYFAMGDVAIYPYDDTLINRTKCAVKLIDLMAAGKAIVADRVGQNGEYIEHGVSGLLVEPGDDEAFAGEVVRLLRDGSLRERLGREAARRVREHFAWERLAQQVERAYGVTRGA